MELAIALIIFAAMIAVWFMLPGTVTADETHPVMASEGMTMTPAKA
jgi:tellurite resistance protein TehA-like permease